VTGRSGRSCDPICAKVGPRRWAIEGLVLVATDGGAPRWRLSRADGGMQMLRAGLSGRGLARRDAVKRLERFGWEVQITGGDVFG
jgi:hypothetical protein